MIKVAYISLSTYSSIGGIQNHNKTYLQALEELEGIDYEHISLYDNSDTSTVGFENNRIKFILFMLKSFLFNRYDVYVYSHINLFPILILGMLISPFKKSFFLIHGVEIWKTFNAIYRFLFQRINIIYTTKYSSERFIDLNCIKSRENFYYCPPCIPIRPVVYKNQNSSKFKVLCITRLDSTDSYKGVDTLIESFAILKRSRPDIYKTVQLSIVGKGDDLERLEKMSKQFETTECVKFIGYVESIENIINESDLFVLPSSGEGFGIVYIEAMINEIPVIGCDVGGQTDIIENGKNGLLIPYGDASLLASHISFLSDNPIERNRMGRLAREKVVYSFSFDKFKVRLQSILNN